MSKPRIAILHYSCPPVIGGVESTLRDHAVLLARHDYPCKIITGRGEPFDSRIPVDILPLLHSRDPRVQLVQSELAQGRVTASFEGLVAELRRALAAALADTDILLAHNVLTLHKNLALTAALHQLAHPQDEIANYASPLAPPNMGKNAIATPQLHVGALSAPTSPLRLIAWSHDFAWTDPVYEQDVHEGLPWSLLKQAWQGVRYVVVSESRRDELARLLGMPQDEIAVVPPGLDPAAFLQLGAVSTDWASKFNLLDANPLLLLPARVTRRKNIELAIDVTGALRAQDMSPKLLVMGPLGPHNPANRAYLDELKARRSRLGLQDAVIFLGEYGAVDDLARRDLYALADALFFPSAREGFGIPILEAGLGRLPIFCADIPPLRESAQGYANYFALDASPAQIAAQVRSVLTSDARFQLKQRVSHHYNWERIFIGLIEPLLQSPLR